jgi:hypothetical protein
VLQGVDWIHVAQNGYQWRALVKVIINLRVLKKAEDFLTSWTTNSFSSMTLAHELTIPIIY